MRIFRVFSFLLACLILSAGCARYRPGAPGVAFPVQDLTSHLATGDVRVFSAVDQDRAALRSLQAHFSPWDRTVPAHSAEDMNWGFAKYAERTIFGENLLPRPASWLDGLKANAAMSGYPNLSRPAIATANTSLRVLPTLQPVFYDPEQPGEGFPFDYAQNSAVWAGTPLFAAHLSADGAWLLCETRYAAGWVPLADLAFVDKPFMRRFRAGPFFTFTRDRVPVRDSIYRFSGRIGSLLPVTATEPEGYSVLAPVRDADGKALLREVRLDGRSGALFPLAGTARNIAVVANRLLGEPYGWGGLYGDRDCSATLMDLFSVFGLALPRNSRQQSLAGESVSLETMTADEKKETILARGRPLVTMLYKPGHIMLYVGRDGDEPLIYHTLWGLKDTSTDATPGRLVVGRTVVTTTEPCIHDPGLVKPSGILLESITSMILLDVGKDD